MKELQIRLDKRKVLVEDVDMSAVPIFEVPGGSDPVMAAVDRLVGGLATRLAAQEGFTGKAETSLALTCAGPGLPARVLLAGAGKEADFDGSRQLALAARVARSAQACHLASVGLLARGPGTDAVYLAGLGLSLGAYSFDRYRTADENRPTLARAVVSTTDDAKGDTAGALARARTCANAVCQARDLVNEPGGAMTPARLADVARTQALAAGLEVEVLDRKALQDLGAGLILGVGAAGRDGPSIVRLAYRPCGAAIDDAIALVGQGITFDSGGLNLKPRGSIDDMKQDMAGAAAVLAAMTALPALGCTRAVRGYLAIADNLVGADAIRPGDVLTSLSGKTVEIADTDAEGRLVLADAMTLAIRQGAARLVELSTLTGACVVALGEKAAGLFTADDGLADALLAAGRRAGEDLWRLPMYESQKGQLKSDVADLKNVGERWGGAIQGAVFLAEFAEGRPFAHLDIAGPAFSKKEDHLGPKGATGFGVRTLIEYLTRPT